MGLNPINLALVNLVAIPIAPIVSQTLKGIRIKMAKTVNENLKR